MAGQPVQGFRRDGKIQPPLLQPLLHLPHLQLHNAAQLLLAEGLEDDPLVNAVQKLRPEVSPQGLVHPLCHLAVACSVASQIQDRLAADVAREDHHGVGEVHGAAVAVGDASVVQHLQQHVEHVGMGLLDLVQQHHGIGPPPHGLRELAALLVADVAGRGTDEPGNRVLFHVLRHVQPHHGLFAIEQLIRQGLAQFRFAHTRGAQEQEGGNGSPGIGQTGAGALNGVGNAAHRLVLANHPLVQLLLQAEQLFQFRLHQAGHRYARPLADHLGNVVLAHVLAQQGLIAVARVPLPLPVVQLPLQLRQGSILQFGGPVEVVAAFGLIQLQLHLLDLFLEGLQVIDGAFLLLPLGVKSVLAFGQVAQIPVEPREALLARGVVLAGEGELFHLQLEDAAVDFVDFLRLGRDFHLQTRCGFVHQIDGLIGQEAVADVAAAQHGGCHQGTVADAHAVVNLVALLQTTEDGDGVFNRGLIHEHLLQPPLQGRILLDVLAVLVEGGGTDAAQFTAGQHGLEQIAGIHGPVCRARTHNRVDFVDEEHHLPRAGRDLLQHGLEAFFEFTAILRPCNESTHIEGNQLAVLQGRRHVTIHDALRQAFHDGRFANAGLANQHGVVLGAAREDLYGAPDFVVPANHGVQLPLARRRAQIAPELLQRLVGGLRLPAGDFAGATHRLDGLQQCLAPGPKRLDDRCAAAPVTPHRQEQVLDGNKVVAKRFALLLSPLQHRGQPAAEIHVQRRTAEARQLRQGLLQALADRSHVNIRFLQQLRREPLLLQQGMEQVFAVHLLMQTGLG